MKLARLLFLLCLLTFLCTSARAQCPTGSVVLETDAEVANFLATYPSCASLPGDLNIQSGVSDVTPLQNLKSIGGTLTIRSTPLKDLVGLENIVSIDGGFGISEIDAEDDLASTPLALQSVGGRLSINSNSDLKAIDALQNLESVDELSVTSNNSLSNLAGLGNATIANDVVITNNTSLSDCTAQSICSYIAVTTNSVTISGNDTGCSNYYEALAACVAPADCPQDLSFQTNAEIAEYRAAFPSCTSLPGNLLVNGTATNLGSIDLQIVQGNVTIAFIAVSDLDRFEIEQVGGNLLLSSMSGLVSTLANGPLPLQSVGGRLTLLNLPGVESAAALQNVTSLGGLAINTMPELGALDAFDGLALSDGIFIDNNEFNDLDILSGLDLAGSTMEFLRISGNPDLTDIDVLAPVTVTVSLRITDNQSLSECAIASVCEAVADPGVGANISANGSGCNTLAEVNLACNPDLQALLALYNATDGPNWADNSGWADGAAGTNTDPCDGTWNGVTCSGGRVRILILSRENLTGSIDLPEWSLLTNLNLLNLRGNNLTGPIPANLFSLPSISNIQLGQNDFTGGIPAAVGNGTGVSLFTIDDNPNLGGTIPPEITDMTNLQFLSMSNCGLTGGLPNATIGNLTNLTGFIASSNNLNGQLGGNFGLLTDLQVLDLRSNNFSNQLPGIFGLLTNLERLYLSDNNFTGSLPPSLGQGLALTDLFLQLNEFTGTINPNLRNLTALERIDLSENDFSGGPVKLDQSPNLTFYDLSNAGLSGPVADDLLSSTVLETVDLSENAFTGALPLFPVNSAGASGSLQTFKANNNAFTGCYPAGYTDLCGVFTDFTGNADLPLMGADEGFETEFCLNGNPCGADCPTGSVQPNTQAEIDNFPLMWPNCTELPGSLQMNGTDAINSLAGFANLTKIGTDPALTEAILEVFDLPNVTSLAGLDNLTSVGTGSGATANGRLVLANFPAADLDELVGLTGDLKEITLDQMSLLTDVSALGSGGLGGRGVSVASIGTVQELYLFDNPQLADLTGVDELNITDELRVSGNTSLTECAVTSFCDAVAAGSGVALDVSDNGAGCTSVAEISAACSALPVSWLSFTATATDKQVRLKWSTADEEDNAGFSVERSPDGRVWSAIATVAPALGAAAENQYTHTDVQPLNGINYYRIRQTDLDGAESFSPVAAVTLRGGEVLAYPNPFTNELTVTAAEESQVEVYDLNGRQLLSFQHQGGGAQVQRLVLKPGVYTLKVVATGKIARIVKR